MATSQFRRAVRGVILDEDDQILLCHFSPPHPAVPEGATGVWAAPGGGIESGEHPIEALRRELLEETGLVVDTDPLHVWHQEVLAAGHGENYDGVINDYFLVRTPHFDSRAALPDEEIAAECITEMRWWALEDIRAADDNLFSPRDLALLLAPLIDRTIPSDPIELGL
jgi:8-oxo-dGTP diphosphatase